MPPPASNPQPREPLSLRQRLVFAVLTPLIAILATSSFFDYRLAKQTADRAHDQALVDDVLDLEGHLKKHFSGGGELDLAEETEALLRSNAPDMLYFSVMDSKGQVLVGDRDLPAIQPQKSQIIEFSDTEYRGKPVRAASHRVTVGGEELTVVCLETTEKRRQSSQRIMTAMVLPNLAVILATMLAVILGVRQGLLPLEEVERNIAARSANDLHEIELAATPAEIRPMLQRLNHLFQLLRESVEVQKRFIADAAHQLRTPLAGLQTQIDLAAVEDAFAGRPERLRLIEESTDRLEHLLSQLLAHARAETSSPEASRSFATVELEVLAENSATLFIDAALAKEIDLGFEIESASTQGISWMLQEALSNLIDNAIRYTPKGGIITVRSGSVDASPFLEVQDSGPGISEDQLEHVCKRFYRIPGSPGNGCGLGLAIVREIAEVHDARLVFRNASPAGMTARLVFPSR